MPQQIQQLRLISYIAPTSNIHSMKPSNSKNGLKTRDFQKGKHEEEPVRLKRIEEMENGSKVEKWCIGKYKYSLNDLLGTGYSSNVYKATLINNNKERFALKVIGLQKFKGDALELLQAQIQIIKNLNHPNIIKCLDVYRTEKNYFLVTEYCPHGDLEELIKLQKRVAEDRALTIMKQIIDGYKHLLARNIIHRDLKPANVMRFGNKWKIGDFGFSRYAPQQFVLEKITLGTPLYMALECLQCSKYSYKSDIFSLGVIFYEMLTGQTPWPGRNQQELLNNMKNNPKIEIPETMTPQIHDFIQKTVVPDYYERMTKEEFKKISFDQIDIKKLAEMRSKGMSPAHRTASKSNRGKLLLTPIKCMNLKSNTENGFKNRIGAITPRPTPTYKETLKNKNIAESTSRVKAVRQKIPTNQDTGFNQYYTTTSNKSLSSEYQDFVHPNCIKGYEKNTQIIRHQIQFCKMIINLIQNIHYFMLDKKERVYMITILYSFVTKNLKMLGNINSRINVLRLQHWDTFKNSDRYHKNLFEVMESYEIYHSWFLQYMKGLDASLIKQIRELFPELFLENSLNYRFYRNFFLELKQLVSLYILKPKKEVQDDDKQAYANGISQLIQIMKILQFRTTKQNQIKGIGLRQKPEIIQNYSVSSSQASIKSQIKVEYNKKLSELAEFLNYEDTSQKSYH